MLIALTPTMLGSLLAGVALWLMFWYGVNHVDSIPYLNQYLSQRMILDWIKRNPQTFMLLTEGVNLLLHGIAIGRSAEYGESGSVAERAGRK